LAVKESAFAFEVEMMQGLILSGGSSSRLGQNKMMLKIKGIELICHTVESMSDFVDDIFIVAGFYNDDIEAAVKKYPKVFVVRNLFYEQGMFSSVQYGVRFLKQDLFLIPGDIPFVSKDTFRALSSAPGTVRIPVYQGHPGHPVFLSKALVKELAQEDKNSTLKAFLDKHSCVLVDVPDPFILRDIDTMEDYQQMKSEQERKD
jgi:molybdenum cofactor cytidylyltransferase